MITPIIIPQPPHRRRIVKDGRTYEEVLPGDESSAREVGLIILAILIWFGAFIWALDQNWNGYIVSAIGGGPILLVALIMIIFGGK